MTSLGCFKDRQRLIEALLNSKYENKNSHEKIFDDFYLVDIIQKKLFIFYYLIVNYVNQHMKIQKILNNEVVRVHVRRSTNFFMKLIFFSLADFPQKRIDRQRSNGTNVIQTPNPNAHRSSTVAQLTEGSPLIPRRPLYSNIK
jgi:hypothetical protein